ncbi:MULTISPECIES: PIN/TRAM domain-containing protein [Clostridium]|uniref:PIN/TRAM domain-containing protein n=1 Tax=Clostridium paridis TaxID=2803863 RepID=A0A937FET4_9CLOT|nr:MULTISPECIES: PIN/TRAM domain-containing protein [Clostridium]MBL4930271.1 PIN/TRAM domain-containing protein [Clostridium paridis]
MLKKILRIVFSVIGLIIGFIIGDALLKIEVIADLGFFANSTFGKVSFLGLITVLFGIILFLLSPFIYNGITRLIEYVEKSMQRLSASEIIFGAVGAIIVLIITTLISLPLNKLYPIIGPIMFTMVNIIAAVIGADVSIKKKEDITNLLLSIKRGTKEKKSKVKGIAKVLDTSVIIDGRIFDICQTGFVEGPLVIPSFVLDELRHISDSSDSLKRNRGRRGLDILNKIQKELAIEVEIWEGDFPEIAEVDSKLLKLAQKLNGKVVTNDYNLNKVAEFQGVPVLNINELANAIKPVVIPGEEMRIQVIKDGKESGQGVAYLDDGTMIVVEGGRRFIGEELDVVVTSVLQTAAGRMIFARQKEA